VNIFFKRPVRKKRKTTKIDEMRYKGVNATSKATAQESKYILANKLKSLEYFSLFILVYQLIEPERNVYQMKAFDSNLKNARGLITITKKKTKNFGTALLSIKNNFHFESKVVTV